MPLLDTLSEELTEMASAGTLKRELSLQSPQGPVVEVEGKGEVIMLTSNNYLGLADHPALVEAAEKGERDFGYGLASVRFICGTQTIHRIRNLAEWNERAVSMHVYSRPIDSCVVFDMDAQTCYRRDLKYDYE